MNGELKEFIQIIDILSTFEEIEKINFKIIYLPLGRKFSFLKNRLNRRRAITAKIRVNGEKFILIEVEQEEYLLSTLILKYNNYINFDKICKKCF